MSSVRGCRGGDRTETLVAAVHESGNGPFRKSDNVRFCTAVWGQADIEMRRYRAS